MQRAAVVLVGIVILLVACGEVEAGDADGPSEVIGFENIFSNAASWEAWNDARLRAESVIAECMAEAGFEYVAWTNSADDVRFRAYALTEDEHDFATEFGFGLVALEAAAQQSGHRSDRPVAENHADLSDVEKAAFDAAYHGVEDDEGCEARGDAEQVGVGFEIVLGLDELRARRAQFMTDPGVAAHYSGWSACMSDRGFAHTSPIHAFVEFEERSVDLIAEGDERAIATESADEIAVATATVECGEPVRRLLPDELRDLWEIHATS